MMLSSAASAAPVMRIVMGRLDVKVGVCRILPVVDLRVVRCKEAGAIPERFGGDNAPRQGKRAPRRDA